MTNHSIGRKEHSAFIEKASNLILAIVDLKKGHSALVGCHLEGSGLEERAADEVGASSKARRIRRGLIKAGVARLRNGLDCEPAGRSLMMQMLTLLLAENRLPVVAPGAGAIAVSVGLDDERCFVESGPLPLAIVEPVLERDDAGTIRELKHASVYLGDPRYDMERMCNLVISSDKGLFEPQALSVRHCEVGELVRLAQRKLGGNASRTDLTTIIPTTTSAIADYQHALKFSGIHLPPVLLNWRKKRRLLAAYMLVVLRECGQLDDVLADPSKSMEIVF